jgi:hypothetical protein
MLHGHFAFPKPRCSAQVVRFTQKPISRKSSTERRKNSNRCDRGPAGVTACRAEARQAILASAPQLRRTITARKAGLPVEAQKKEARLEWVKRSDSNFYLDLCLRFQLLEPSSNFLCWTFRSPLNLARATQNSFCLYGNP